MRLREVVCQKCVVIGDRADFRTQVKNRELEFTDWQFFDNRYGKGVILQFFENDRPYVFITHSICLAEDVKAWEDAKGKEPFMATVVEKRTKDGRMAYVFE